jgi:hypothetical protein
VPERTTLPAFKSSRRAIRWIVARASTASLISGSVFGAPAVLRYSRISELTRLASALDFSAPSHTALRAGSHSITVSGTSSPYFCVVWKVR